MQQICTVICFKSGRINYSRRYSNALSIHTAIVIVSNHQNWQFNSHIMQFESTLNTQRDAVARKPRDAADVLFGLKFADNIHYKLRKPRIRAPNIPAQNTI